MKKTIARAQRFAAHESPRTTRLYDRRARVITLHKPERMRV
jgi:hypothetical protein